MTEWHWISYSMYFQCHCLEITFFSSRCPSKNDYYLTSLIPVVSSSGLDFPSHYRRFLFKMFTFVDPNSKQPLKEQVMIKSIDKDCLQQNILVLLCQHCFPCSDVHSLQYSCVSSYARQKLWTVMRQQKEERCGGCGPDECWAWECGFCWTN